MVNLHFSLLPRWRGAAPVERALLAGDAETGVCVMQLEEGLDTGPVFACERCRSRPDETADDAAGRLVDAGTALLVGHPRRRASTTPGPRPASPPTPPRSSPPSSRLDWSAPAVELDRLVRLGGAWTTFRGKRLKVLAADRRCRGRATSAGGPGRARRRPGRHRRRRARAPRGAARGQGADAGGGVAQRRPARTRRAARRVSDAPARARRLRGAAAHRPRRRLRQPRAARRCSTRSDSTTATGPSSPSSSTARPACAGRATSSSTASSSRTRRPSVRTAAAPRRLPARRSPASPPTPR